MTQTPPDLDSARSMMRIAWIITVVLLILTVLGALYFTAVYLAVASTASNAGVSSGILAGVAFIYLAFFAIALLIQLLIFWMIRAAQRLTDQGHYQQAKDRLLIPMILGFIFQYIVGGIFLLLAYLKFDPVITWQRTQGQQQQPQPMWGAPPAQPQPATWGQPQPQTWGQPSAQPQQPAAAWGQPAQPAQPAPAAAPVMASPPPAAPAAPPAVVCPRCGKPATWVAQYSRWYCYTDAQYL